jgi:DNA-binding PadR family transcriptional regulator
MGPRHRGFGGWGNFGQWPGWSGPQAGGPGFKWRFFDRGDLKYVILKLLRDKPMHGYEVMRALEHESGGCYKASAGSIYPTLQMLEDLGFVTSKEADGKKVYSITDAGRKHLEENKDVVEEIAGRVSDFTDRFFRADMRDLTKTFSKLAQVTFERSVKWPGSNDVIAQMKEILERATHDMEAVRPRTPDNA